MLALGALVIFILALFGVHLGSIDLVTLGFCFLAAHMAFGWGIPWGRFRGNPPA